MNINNIKNIVKHLEKNCNCMQCNKKYNQKDIHIVASTETEGVFEAKCEHCGYSTIINVVMAKEGEIERERIRAGISEKISQNDILDIKNFLSNFDGNFKKIFNKRT